MSLCIRTISSKLPTRVGTRKQVAQLERRLKNVPQSKMNNNLAFVLKDYALNMCKASVTSNHEWCVNDKYVVKIQSLNDNNNIKDYQIKYNQDTTNLDQINKFSMLYQNNDPREVCLFSNVRLKEKLPSAFGKSMSDDVENNASQNDENSSREGRPSLQQIEKIKEHLSYDLSRFFVQMMDYHIYTKDVVLVNNIKGTTTNGFFMYYLQTSLLKIYAHFKFIYVKFHILKITANPEDDSVKVRWRIAGISGMKLFSRFFKFKPLQIKDTIQKEQESWCDGFSTFYINSDGKVYKIVIDKIMPDSDKIVEDKEKLKIPVKLAMCLGISNLDFLLSDIVSKM